MQEGRAGLKRVVLAQVLELGLGLARVLSVVYRQTVLVEAEGWE